METVNKLSYILIFIILLTSPLYAQNPGESSNKVVVTAVGQRLYQVISFPEVPNTLRYEVEIEQIDGENTTLINNVRTSVNRVEVSLRAGFYRYRVTAYNRMGLLEGISDWQEFSVLMGIQPTGASYQPYYALFFEMHDPNSVLTIYGDNFYDDTEFALVKKRKAFNWSGINLEGRDDVIIPTNAEVDVNTAYLSFSRDSLKRGRYEIFIRNPGGLWTCFGEVQVGSVSGMDLTVSGGYSPMIVFYDLGSEIISEVSHGSSLRLGWLPIKSKIGNFGLEAQADIVDYNFTFNLLYQNTLNGRLQLNFRLGMDYVENSHHYELINNAGNEVPSPLAGIYLNIGSSIQYFLWKNLFLEAGLDIQYVLPLGDSIINNYLTFRPGISIGWQLGRWSDFTEAAETVKSGHDYSVPITNLPKAESLFSFTWSPMINLNFDNSISLDNYHFGGINLRYAFLPVRWDNSKLGFKIELGIVLDDTEAPSDLLGHLYFGLYYQNVLSPNWQIGVHAGIGILNNNDIFSSVTSPYIKYPNPALLFGASIQRFFPGNVYLEIGVDAAYYGNRKDLLFWPSLAAGMQFNYNNERGIRFPSGMYPSERKEKLTITNPLWWSMHQITFGWKPLRNIGYSGTYGTYNTTAFGFNLHYAFMPIQWDIHKLGIYAEISLGYEYADNDSFWSIGIRYQNLINENSLLNFEAAYMGLDLFSKLGFSFQNYIWKNLYVEAGVEVLFDLGKFIRNIPADNNYLGLLIRPILAIGWNFGGRTRMTQNASQYVPVHDWEFNNGTITGYNGTQKVITIPPVINRELVETIGVNAFRNKTLESIRIPEGIKVIENDAFSGCGLFAVVIPSGLTSIGNSAFRNNRLYNITIPPSVGFIGANAFASNPITTIVIGENVIMDVNAFANNFVRFYTENNSQAGTYTYRSFRWNYREE
ncbi:MAG: leucine-rich repeat domain-containing protein [Treponema sp.]|nr:leucine-rich repeat domain-containing protein [Treponema sp.]